MSKRTFSARPALTLSFACCWLAIALVQCGNGNKGRGSAGTAGGAGIGGGAGGGGAGANDGGAGSADASSGGPAGASGDTACGGTSGTAATGGAAPTVTFKNYEVSGTFLTAPVAVVQKPGRLKYTKIVIQDQFLAESCAIGDYNGDGIPDVSSGRIWYEGTNDPKTTFMTKHPFRDGHGPLPRAGNQMELYTGASDDWADYPWDVDGDGDPDIINIAQPDVLEANSPTLPQGNEPGTPNKIGTVQVHATAYWYENPGKAGQAGDPNWTPHLMHDDVRNEQHGLVDINGDGYPELYGGCKSCTCPNGPARGYYQGDPAHPTAAWTYHQVTGFVLFPTYGKLNGVHGMGAGDVNGDGLVDLLDRDGAYLQQSGGMWNLTVCTGKNTPAGCGFIRAKTPLLPTGFSLPTADNDPLDQIGPSHMFAVDMDKDGCTDVVAADYAHGVGLFWYQQGKDAGGCNYQFTKYQFMGDSVTDKPDDVTKWGAGFTVPHAVQVYDMDGDGRFDVISGKMRFARPLGFGDPDASGTPYLYVFKNVAMPDSRNGAPITLQPFLVDGDPTATEGTTDAGMGVGRQIAIGHVNTDGIMDICVATKLGLAVFLGQ